MTEPFPYPRLLPYLRQQAAAVLDRDLTQTEAVSIGKYLEILSEWNRTQRLVGSSEPHWLVDNVILDSLLFLKAFPDRVVRLLDIGSGAGVPGIPLKIVRPEIELVMVEARRKRASFLAVAARTLGLSGTRIVNSRIELLTTAEIGVFDTIVGRCAGSPASFFSQARRFLKPDGVAIMSGPPGRGGISRDDLEWVEVFNPLTGRPRSFAVLRSSPGVR